MKLAFALPVVLLALSSTDCHAQKRLGLFGNGNGRGNNGNGNGIQDKRNSEVKIKQCNGRKCDIDITKLDLDGDSISFELRGNGRKIKCNKSSEAETAAKATSGLVSAKALEMPTSSSAVKDSLVL